MHSTRKRGALVAVLAAVLLALFAGPASANTPNYTDRLYATPWQCGLPSWSPGYGVCKTWKSYADNWYGVNGSARRSGYVARLLAQAGPSFKARAQAAGWASQYGSPACQQELKSDTLGMLDKSYANGHWATTLSWATGKVLARVDWEAFPSIDQVDNVSALAQAMGSKLYSMQTAQNILYMAMANRCIS